MRQGKASGSKILYLSVKACLCMGFAIKDMVNLDETRNVAIG